MGVKNPNAGIFDILKILAIFRASKLKNGLFWRFLRFHSPTRTRKTRTNQNFKNSRIRIVKHPILMMYTEIHMNSIKTERLDRFLPKFTLKFMLFLLYKDFPIYPLDLPSHFGAQNCEKFVFFNSVKKSDLSMSLFKTYLKIEKKTLDPPPSSFPP